MRYSEEIIEEVRLRADIAEIIGEFIPLKKRGNNYIGLCPFHNEKTPSFNVSTERKIYKCFGCGKSGNTFSFLMEHAGMSFIEAVEYTAKECGITLPEKSQPAGTKTEPTKRSLTIDALKSAAAFYSYTLHTEKGKAALDYLNNREFNNDIIIQFSLGYAPDSWDSVIKELGSHGFTEEIMLEAGLVIKKENGGCYDRFRGRATFAIKDHLGRIVGFGARRMNEDKSQPKYINSPQTIVYDKSKILYGLFEAKNNIRSSGTAILVEGYADALTLHRAGFTNTVASSGTALTLEQLDLLKKYCSKLLIVYDADSAGANATERGLELALSQGFETFIVRLPEGEDPDSFVRNRGQETFRRQLDTAVEFLDFKLDTMRKSGKLNNPADSAAAIRNIIGIISKIPDRLQHDFYISRLASKMQMSEYQVQRIYEEKANSDAAAERHDDRHENFRYEVMPPPSEEDYYSVYENPSEESKQPEEISSETILREMFPEEKMLIKFAIEKPEYLNKMFEQHELCSDNFVSDAGKYMFSIIVNLCEESSDLLNEII
ncbi:MAG: primase, partial [Bacteroidota bacterium]|nr:primase [Bacteroidota bacterium]